MVFESAASFLDNSPSIEDVEREIEFHLDFIRTVRGYRNARLLSISKLPSDVLSMIFEYLALSPNPPRPSHPYSAWLPATQVCRGWREIALDTPRMWSCFYGKTRQEFVELLLQRSKSVSLHIRSLDFIPLVLKHAYRLAEIDIHYTEASNSPLKILDISFFRDLHTLKLSGPGTEPVIDMLLALCKMEQLETLELIYVLGTWGTTEIPDDTIAFLPHLTSLRITTLSINQLLILSHFRCPNVKVLYAQCARVVYPDEVAPGASAFYSLIPNPSTWRTMLVSTPIPPPCRSARASAMNIWPTALGCHAPPKESPFQLHFYAPPDFQTDLTLCSVLPTRGPSGLLLRSGNFVDSDALQRCLRALDSVREAFFVDVQDIFTVLRDTPAVVGDNGKLPSFSLPSLTHMYWHQLNPINKEHTLATLEQMLSARQTIGAGIGELTINTSHMQLTEADVAPLRSSVRTLSLVQHEWECAQRLGEANSRIL